jgi:hypothetical protein
VAGWIGSSRRVDLTGAPGQPSGSRI